MLLGSFGEDLDESLAEDRLGLETVYQGLLQVVKLRVILLILLNLRLGQGVRSHTDNVGRLSAAHFE